MKLFSWLFFGWKTQHYMAILDVFIFLVAQHYVGFIDIQLYREKVEQKYGLKGKHIWEFFLNMRP